MKEFRTITIIGSFLLVLVFVGSGFAEWLERHKFVSPNGKYFDWYGASVHISGDYLIVGAPGAKIYFSVEMGAAYIYKRELWGWVYKKVVIASDGASYDLFGNSVGMDGEYAIIGAFRDDDLGADSGSAYIFKGEDAQWSQQTKLRASDGRAGDRFGQSVSISGDYAIVGCPFHDDDMKDNGAAYIYKRTDTGWVEEAKLTASDAAAGDLFGWSISLSGRYAIVGSRSDDTHGSGSGSAYIFELREGEWIQLQKLTASDGVKGANFGYSVFMKGDQVIIGAAYENEATGSAYVFEREGESWVEQAKLTASDGAECDYFGYSVSICGDYAIVGAMMDDDLGQISGSAYVFKRNVSGWSEHVKLTASDGSESNLFGSSVSIDGKYIAVGAEWHNSDIGASYIFIDKEPMTYYVDADANGANDGSSWADAFNYLQDGLDATWKDDKVWVAEGEYRPDDGIRYTEGDREAAFALKNEVAIKGGYAGFGEPDPNARDIDLYETILSGDLDGNDKHALDPCDLLNDPNRDENSYHVVSTVETNNSAVLDGFIITGGNANGAQQPIYFGGGIYNENQPSVNFNCTTDGPTIRNCTITLNSASGEGGGMYNRYSCNPKITDCVFVKNIGGWGGGRN